MKKKDLTKPKSKDKTIRLPISKFIDTKFRDYALYVLTSRGIPSFYDALTPVQRFILQNTNMSYTKTLSVVGKCFQDSYHHGDSSLEGAINKLARPFGNALQVLDGYGFFGSEVSPSPAASRYTSVKLSKKANEILNKYSYLTTREPDGPYDDLWMDVPLGLTIPIVGIAVGYKTTILPRKLDHVKSFLDGGRKGLKPYFEGFNGTIRKHNGLDKSWFISSNFEVEGNRIMIREIPPILKYTAVLKKLDYLFNTYENRVRIINNSNTKVNIDIVYRGKSTTEWEDIQKYIKKIFSIVVTENPVFIKDGQVLVYDSIEQYLEDYKWQIARLKYKNAEYEHEVLTFDLEFNIAKDKFIQFMLQRKRSNKEIDVWFKDYSKKISERLERMTARKFTKDELKAAKQLITQLTKELKDKIKELAKVKKIFEDLIDPTLERGVSSKKNVVNLFDTDDISQDINGITIWDGNDVYEENGAKPIDEDE